MIKPGMTKAEVRRFWLDFSCGIVVGFMCSLRWNVIGANRPLRDALRDPEIAASFAKVKDTRRRALADHGGPRQDFTLQEGFELSLQVSKAMDDEAERILRLDDQGLFNPDKLDMRSVLLWGVVAPFYPVDDAA